MSDPTEPLALRPATADDGDRLVAVHVAAIRERGGDAYDAEGVDAWAADKRPERYPLDEAGVEAVVAERGDEVVGFGWVDLEAAEVTAVYVHPDHDREGVGSAILERLETRAREADLGELSLLSSKNAVGFYERRGYERVETVAHETRGAVLECVRMRKRLDGGSAVG